MPAPMMQTPTAAPTLTTLAPTPAPMANSGEIAPIVAYDKNGVTARFEFVKTPGNLSLTQINVTITSRKMVPLTNFALLAAVPKFIKLQLNPASSSTLPPNGQGNITQI